MGMRFRKSFKIAPGVKLNLSKRGIGVSAGVKGGACLAQFQRACHKIRWHPGDRYFLCKQQ